MSRAPTLSPFLFLAAKATGGRSMGVRQARSERALAEAGGDVVLAARRTDKLEEAVEAIRAKGLAASALQLDVADVLEVQVSIDKHGPFDVLVNSAGLARHSAAVSAITRSRVAGRKSSAHGAGHRANISDLFSVAVIGNLAR